MKENFQKSSTYLLTSDDLVAQATVEEIAELVRMPALPAAQRRTQYGDVPIEESLEMLSTERHSD